MGGHDYTENLKGVHDGLTDLTKNVNTLIQAMNTNKSEETERRKQKVIEQRQQREEERTQRQLELTENNTALTASITTAFTNLSTTIAASVATAIVDQLRPLLPPVAGNHGGPRHNPPPPPPPRQNNINLKFPQFDGDDPDGWLFNADQYFAVHTADDALKITIASANLKGDANVWFRWKQSKAAIVTWTEFGAHLRARFAPEKFVDPRLAISNIEQKGTVREHIPVFEHLMNLVDFTEEHLIQCFIRSLKPQIGSALRLLDIRSLDDAFKKAIHQEEALAAKSVPRQPYRPPPFRPAASVQPTPYNKSSSTPVYRHLSPAEQRERREKGLCFNCDEVYKKDHVCLNPRLTILDVENYIREGSTTTEDTAPVSFEVSEVYEFDPTISLSSLFGSSFPRTMRVTGRIKSQPITILIDLGSTHNFLHPSVAKQCGFEVCSRDSPLSVTVGDGGKLNTRGSCPSVHIQLPSFRFSADFHLLDISGCDVVLGVQWLRTLGPIEWDFARLSMQFTVNGKTVSLLGNNHSSVMIFEQKSMQRLLQHANHGVFIELAALTISLKETSVIDPQVQQLLAQFTDIFKQPTTLPPERLHDHRIPLVPGSPPVNVRPYRYPYFQKSEIEKIVAELQFSGFIRPSSSPYSSPVLMVRKKDGSWRMCVDYRALNKLTIKDRFPIPVVDDLLDELHGATVFTKLDLRSGYHQIRLHKADIPKTAFRTHDGHYEFLVMPFGLSNAPSTFQSLMNDSFREYLRKFVLVFFDDILIYSKNMSDHLIHLSQVFEVLRSNQLFVKESKCTFAQSSVGYLGHVISAEGVSVEQEKIECIMSWPTPTTIRELRGFLGLAGYYRKFVKDFGKISAPLTQLLKKNAFQWSEKAIAAFKLLQTALTTTPVLILPDFSKEFAIECDASGFGLGVVLLQSGRPIAFHSKPLAEKNKNLTKISSLEQQKWLSKLLGYDYEIIFRPGKDNAAAGALSRQSSFHYSLTAPVFSGVTEIMHECHNDTEYGELIQRLVADPTYKRNYSYVDGILRYKCRIVVVSTSSWCSKILQEFHSTPIGGHSGFLRTYKRIQHNFYWKGLKQSVKNFILHCEVCQRNKSEAVSPPGFLNPLPIPTDNTQLCRSSAYHPQSDGQTEVTNRTLECYLRCFAGMKPTDWSKWLPWAEWWYNTSFHSAIRMSPYQALYSRPPPAVTAYLPGSTSVHDVELNLKARDHTLKLLKSHLHDAQSRMKKYADSHRTERSFSVDDWVYLRLQSYRQTTVSQQSFSKLSPKFYGPFRILEKIGSVAYKLELPASSRIHPVVHVSQLKLKVGSTTSVEQVLPDIIDYEKWEPDSILDRRMYKKGNGAGTRWLIKWKNHAPEDATWEDADDFIAKFPEFEA
ncbi:uncharacterized protein LOC113346084 [Papaver somniferum]|uniref:uncharacterized protein LOC113346084 n=1 Tax=Papaver somniferum TaxID=3469 RepID=UPI000E6F7019|nr:uncharacterized protein LOC113346084 [Papaver somniferum]